MNCGSLRQGKHRSDVPAVPKFRIACANDSIHSHR
uniref:Uncharacterized protein n=1 Tax=Anguilla anguilla TaxID=7936 RepID=A0A0E9V5G6_ANGAN